MISKQLLDHSLVLLKTLGDSLIQPKPVFATEQSMVFRVLSHKQGMQFLGLVS